MKSQLFALVMAAMAAVATAQPAFAAEQALVTKSNFSGFTHPDWSRPETCSVFADRVEIARGFGYGETSFSATETRTVNVTAGIAQVIAKAGLEPVNEAANNLCDGPSTSIVVPQGTDELVIFSTGGCGSPRLTREGVYSRMLRDLVDAYCPTTHDFSDDN